MASASGTCEGQTLDHPEVLDRENLIEILHNRCIPLNEIENLDKQELVCLFYKFVAPLPQRLHQLKRGTREPPKTAENNLVNKTINTIQGRKRLPETDNSAKKIKIPKSDLEHVLINNGPSKIKTKTKETDLTSNDNLKRPRTVQEVKTKPVKLNRKFGRLDLGTPSGKSSSEISNDKKEQKALKKHRDVEPEISSDSASSHSADEELKQTKKKFKKILISWP